MALDESKKVLLQSSLLEATVLLQSTVKNHNWLS